MIQSKRSFISIHSSAVLLFYFERIEKCPIRCDLQLLGWFGVAGTLPYITGQWPSDAIPYRSCSESRVGDVSNTKETSNHTLPKPPIIQSESIRSGLKALVIHSSAVLLFHFLRMDRCPIRCDLQHLGWFGVAGTLPYFTAQWPSDAIPYRSCSKFWVGDVSNTKETSNH